MKRKTKYIIQYKAVGKWWRYIKFDTVEEASSALAEIRAGEMKSKWSHDPELLANTEFRIIERTERVLDRAEMAMLSDGLQIADEGKEESNSYN